MVCRILSRQFPEGEGCEGCSNLLVGRQIIALACWCGEFFPPLFCRYGWYRARAAREAGS